MLEFSPHIVAGILAGGSSLRMGRPKALLTIHEGLTLIEHVYSVVSRVCDEVVVLAPAVELPAALRQLPALEDARPDGGPLAGLCSLLEYARLRWALLIACDMPYVNEQLLQALKDGRQETVDAIVYERQGAAHTSHACCSLYHSRALAAAQDELHNGNASLQNLLARLRVKVLVPDDTQLIALTNVNTQADYNELS